jgi:membrane protein implicated in regulation of membrane protease activity
MRELLGFALNVAALLIACALAAIVAHVYGLGVLGFYILQIIFFAPLLWLSLEVHYHFWRKAHRQEMMREYEQQGRAFEESLRLLREARRQHLQ